MIKLIGKFKSKREFGEFIAFIKSYSDMKLGDIQSIERKENGWVVFVNKTL